MSGLDSSEYTLSSKVANLKYDLLPNNEESQAETHKFLKTIMKMLIDYLELVFSRDVNVLNFHQPDCLKKKLDMEIPTGDGTPLNQLVTMKHVVLKKMREVIDWNTGDSTFAPGGTISNLYSLLVARYKKFPDVKSKRMSAIPGQLVVFTSEQSSLKIAGAVTGIDTENLINVEADEFGRMCPEALDKKIAEQKSQGGIPIMDYARSGTIFFGAFDPIDKLAAVFKKHDVWLHVDVSS